MVSYYYKHMTTEGTECELLSYSFTVQDALHEDFRELRVCSSLSVCTWLQEFQQEHNQNKVSNLRSQSNRKNELLKYIFHHNNFAYSANVLI
jgi:uncharacterized damage-inducible protein DinB